MIMSKLINIFCNYYKSSIDVKEKLLDMLKKYDIYEADGYSEEAIYNVVIGGDGTFIKACHDSNFSKIPFIGINTGHLGFYQEIEPDNVELAVKTILNDNNTIQEIKLIECDIITEEKSYIYYSVNEVVFKAKYASIIHFDMYVNNLHLQSFSGDGAIFSTPSGSTAYNLSAGGAILFQNLEGFQMTPVAPIKSSIFKSLDKSLVIPSDSFVTLKPRRKEETFSSISIDGVLKEIEDIDTIEIKLSKKVINKVTLDHNWFWKNIKEKLI